MTAGQVASMSARAVKAVIVYASLLPLVFGNSFAYAQNPSRDNDTVSPIKHVIVIIGENRSFDHVFATYVPREATSPEPAFGRHRQRRWNARAELCQGRAKCRQRSEARRLSAEPRPRREFPGTVLPAPLVGGPKDSYIANDSLTLAEQSENGLPSGYYQDLVTRRHGPNPSHARPAHHQRECTARRSFPADQRKHLHLQLLRGEPGSPLLSDVAAAGLQHRPRTQDNPSGCDAQLVSLG